MVMIYYFWTYRSESNRKIDDFFLIPTEEGAQYGLDPRFNVVLRNVEGKYDGFPVVIEASHQLHCLVRPYRS